MPATLFPPCPEAISDQTLLDLRDGVFAADETARLQDHIAGCASCRQRTADFAASTRALLTQRMPLLQERIWQGMQRRALPARRPGLPPWGRIAASALTLALVVALAVEVVAQHNGSGPHVSSQTSTTSLTTPAVTPTVAKLYPPHIITADAAWGTSNTHTLRIDATTYDIQDVLPNGTGVIGTTQLIETTTTFQPVSIVAVMYPGAVVHTLYTISDAAFASVATDGHYLGFIGGVNPTGGPGYTHETLGYIDLTTGRVVTLYDSGSTATDVNGGNRFVLGSVVTHGHLYISHATSPLGISDFDLATGKEQVLLLQNSPFDGFSISWPYMLVTGDVTDQSKNDHFTGTIVDLTTMRTIDVSKYIALQPRSDSIAAINGTNLFTVQEDVANSAINYLETSFLGGAKAQSVVLFALPYTDPIPFEAHANGADDRLLEVSDSNGGIYVWDLQQRQLVSFPSLPSSLNLYTDVILDNGVIGYWQMHNGMPEMVLRQDATLPTAPGASS
jgi:hypothetical protein